MDMNKFKVVLRMKVPSRHSNALMHASRWSFKAGSPHNKVAYQTVYVVKALNIQAQVLIISLRGKKFLSFFVFFFFFFF